MTPLLTGVFASQISGHLDTFTPTGSYDALATYTVPSGGMASITLSGLPTGGQYKHLQIRVKARTGQSSAGHNIGTYIRFNNETSGYKWHEVFSIGTGGLGVYSDSAQWIYTATYSPRSGDTSGVFSAQVIDLVDYASTNKYKTVRTLSGDDTGSYGFVGLMTGVYQSLNPINTINLYTEGGGWAEGSSVSIYGIKG